MTQTTHQQPVVTVVDDDASIRFSLEALLESRGFGVNSFESAEALLDRLEALVADCLLIDIWMPGLSGVELLGKLRDRGIATPAILLTGHGDCAAVAPPITHAVSCVLPKPCEAETLIDAIRQAVAGKSSSTKAG